MLPAACIRVPAAPASMMVIVVAVMVVTAIAMVVAPTAAVVLVPIVVLLLLEVLHELLLEALEEVVGLLVLLVLVVMMVVWWWRMLLLHEVGQETDTPCDARHWCLVPRIQPDQRHLCHDQLRSPRHGQGRSGESNKRGNTTKRNEVESYQEQGLF